MRGKYLTLIIGSLLASAAQGQAKPAAAFGEPVGGGPTTAVPGVLQCVPYARTTSGIRLYGDAHTWWRQAEGKYARGRAPMPGAVMAIQPHGHSTLGHVATVSRIVDSRTILISHANWSSPGQIERNVTAIDVSPTNDWSRVRVWYAPIRNLGGGQWPVSGFIYNTKPGKVARLLKPVEKSSTARVRFGFEPLDGPMQAKRVSKPDPTRQPSAKAPMMRPPKPIRVARTDPRKDPIGAIIALSR